MRRPIDEFDRLFAAEDPAEVSRVAHATAAAILTRARHDDTDAIVERLVAFTADHGIDTIAELWSHASATSLPGALWRLYLLQLMIHDDPDTSALLYRRGRETLSSSDALVAGAPDPASPAALETLIDQILRGAFTGDFAVALDRAAAFCRVQTAGAADLAGDHDAAEPERATHLTTRALRLSNMAEELSTSARLWRRDVLT